jgi:hypothetical protein
MIRASSIPHFVAISGPLVDSQVRPPHASAILRSVNTPAQDPGMFHYSRPHPYVHVLSLRGHRALRRVVVGSALILLGVGYLLKGQGLITGNDLWLIAPALIALSGVVRLVALPGVVSVVRALVRFAVAAYLVVVIEHIGGWTFDATWPVLLIAVGVAQLAHAVYGRRVREEPNW